MKCLEAVCFYLKLYIHISIMHLDTDSSFLTNNTHSFYSVIWCQQMSNEAKLDLQIVQIRCTDT